MNRSWMAFALVVMTGLAGVARGQDKEVPKDSAQSPKPIPLWTGDVPEAQGKEDADTPWIQAFPAPKENATGAAIVICPGGGYAFLASDHEGWQVARYLNSIGVSGFVLKYRLGPKYHNPAEMHDVQRAIRYVRAHAADWGVDVKKVGVMGFSAGGHLASTAVTHFDDGNPQAADPVDKMSCRPDLGILIYPVITMRPPIAHGGSRENLLGKNPSKEAIDEMSNEGQVTEKTPPIFISQSLDDGVWPENSILFFQACRDHGVPVELHLLESGGHGYGMGKNNPFTNWTPTLTRWLVGHQFAKAQ